MAENVDAAQSAAFLEGTGLTTNPIYVQDLAVWLPMLAVAASSSCSTSVHERSDADPRSSPGSCWGRFQSSCQGQIVW